MKIVFDTGVLIGFSQTCLLPLFSEIKGDIGEFLITTGVKYECIDRVRNNMKFKLSSLRINDQLNDFVFTIQPSDKQLDDKTKEILNLTNSIFYISGRPLHIVDFGEAECLALLSLTKANCLAIEERTTRMLIEDPNALLEILKRKHHSRDIELNKEKYNKFKSMLGDVSVIRSVDLLSFAYERGMLKNSIKNKEYLKSALYALKFNGCSVSFEEIDEYLLKLK
ncbi:MAG TPA: hypothetical protein PK685_01830 [archaeon]|jgi:hypothetical protein|nr:hypothetical protein [archaeon]